MKTNLSGLADVLGKSIPTIKSYIRQGLPYEQAGEQGSEWIFETGDVVEWFVQWRIEKSLRHVPDSESEEAPKNSAKELQRRKLQAETEMAEIELAKEKELVVLVDEVAQVVGTAVANLRAKLLNHSRRAAPLVVGETDVDYVQEVLDREINELLTELHEEALQDVES